MDQIPIPVNVKDIADSLPQTAHAIDNALSSVVNIANICLTPIEIVKAHSDYALTKTKMKLNEKLKSIPSGKIVPPEPHIAVPALQAISYSCDCDDLHQMFASLLATAMNIDTKNIAHPAFVDVIKNLSPEDARLFNNLNLWGGVATKCDIRYQEHFSHPILGNPFHVARDGTHILDNLIRVDGFSDLAEMSASMGNLCRLGLFTTSIEQVFTSDLSAYNYFRSLNLNALFADFLLNNSKLYPARKICLIPGIISITTFGLNFKQACN